MADGPVEPDPGDLAVAAAYDERLAAFVDDLNRLHIEHGAPSYGEICGAADVFKLTKAGITDLLTGKRLPSMNFLLEFVRVISNPLPADTGKPRGHRAHPELVDHWRRRWVDLRALNRQVQSPLGRVRNATKHLVETAARTARDTTDEAEEQARQLRSRAEAEAAFVLQEARQQSARLVEDARQEGARLLAEAGQKSARLLAEAGQLANGVRADGNRARAEATRVAQERTAEADRLLSAAREGAEDVRKAAHAEAQAIVDEGRRASRLRTPAALRELREAAERITDAHLPELVRTITGGGPREPGGLTVPSVGLHGRDDVGRLARCFDTLHRELAALAAQQAVLVGVTNAMLVSLARRSGGLVRRQLSLLDDLERRQSDRGQLSQLFELDHLATRMRRSCENLLVVAGADPGPRRTRSVPLVDVLRGAAGAVEQYTRIEVVGVPSAEVVGRAADDLLHLFAELLENGTVFSSPHTVVQATGRALPDGCVLVEIHDLGIGVHSDDCAEINERLADPPPLDASVPGRMGLFVISRLAFRHDVRVRLKPNARGGTTASVTLPAALVRPSTGDTPSGGAVRSPDTGGSVAWPSVPAWRSEPAAWLPWPERD
ncbi:ATP-binding protein [Kitasatospora sp. NPDC059599]|uniref:sensor histidine kinase n=1 Tax=Kitasatospora sp. NPDC059599 TaxID=3346880 RepID=UPI0036A5C823